MSVILTVTFNTLSVTKANNKGSVFHMFVKIGEINWAKESLLSIHRHIVELLYPEICKCNLDTL